MVATGYETLKRWTRPDNYIGADWPDYYVFLGRQRESDALTRSNFESGLAAIGGESDTVQIVRESHWAVGWVEWIAIHCDDDTTLDQADKILAALNDYPVVDEDHLTETEQQEADDVWSSCYDRHDRIAFIRDHSSQFEFQSMAHMVGCVRGEYFSGYASELIY